jgi:hypothetical protein
MESLSKVMKLADASDSLSIMTTNDEPCLTISFEPQKQITFKTTTFLLNLISCEEE